MSADDFQTKYASVMESMLKSAVAETTKLFETMVDELKAEISRIKKENEDLKTRCSQYESARSQLTFYTRETEPPPGRSNCSKKRDRAIQCDLVPFNKILVEQCQPLRRSSLQNQKQQCSYEEMEYALKEHNYETHGEENSQMAFICVKQEDDSSLQSVLKQEEVESTVVCRQVLSDKADSTWAAAFGIEKEGPFINKVFSTREILLPRRQETTQVALELQHSLVVSLAEIKDDMEEESEVSRQKISEISTRGELATSETHQLVVAQPQSEVEPFEKEQPLVFLQQCQREGETSVNEQTDVTLQKYADVPSTPLNTGDTFYQLENGMVEVETSSQPDLSVRLRRRLPHKTANHLQQPVKEILQSEASDFQTVQEKRKSSSMKGKEVEITSAVDTVNIPSSESPQAYSVQAKRSLSIISPSVQERVNTALEDVENSKVGSLSVSSLSRRCSSEKEKKSKSQQPSMDREEGEIQAPSAKVSSTIETLNTTLGKSQQAPSVQPRYHHTSVTLQDAMLLVEAMNQSIGENTLFLPQRTTAPLQTQCVPHVGALQTVIKVPAEPQTLLLPVDTHDAVGSQSITELSTTTQSTITPTCEAQAHIKVIVPKQQQTASLSNTLSSMPAPTAATQTSVHSLQQHRPHPLITLVAPSRRDNSVPHKIIVMPRSVSLLMPRKISAQSPTKLPTGTSTVFAAQNDGILPGSTAAGLPVGTPSLSSVSQKTVYIISSKLLPIVTQSSTTSTDLQSGTTLHPKNPIIIPRQVSAASRKHQSQTIVLTAHQESAKSAAPIMVSSSQLISSSQKLSASVDTQATLDEMATVSSQKRNNTSKNLESPKETASVSETINSQTETCSSCQMSVGLMPTLMSPVVPPTLEQKFSAVVRLTRLPFPISTEESVLVSSLPMNGSSDSLSILKEGTTQEKSPPFVITTQPSESCVLSTNICPTLKETSVAVSLNTPLMSDKPNNIEEKTSFFSENCNTSEESTTSSCAQPSTSSSVSQSDFEKSTTPINTTESSAVSSTAGEPTSNLDEEIISFTAQHCALPKDQTIEERQSSAFIHLTSTTSKDTADPHLQMTKAQFLAQLAVSPVAQHPLKDFSHNSVDTRASCAEISTGDKKSLQKNSIMAQLRSHIKTHLQARRIETKSEPQTETETHTVSPKKPRLMNDYSNDQNPTTNPSLLSPKNPGAAEDVTSLKKTTKDPTPISPKRSGLYKVGVKSKRTVSEPSFVSSRRPNATSESTHVSTMRSSAGRDVVSPKNEKSISVSSRRTSLTRDGVGCKDKKSTFARPRRCSSTGDGAIPKNTKTGGRPNNTKTTSVRPKRTSSNRDGLSPKKTQSTSVSRRTSYVSKTNTSPKISAIELTSVIHRSCTFTKDGSSTKHIKTESNSISPRLCSTSTNGTFTKNTKDETSVRLRKLARKTEESTSFKKQRLIQDGNSPEKNLKVVNANKLAKAAKAKTIAKMKNSNQSKLQNGAKMSQLGENSASCETVKKCMAKAVWTPPKMPASETPPTEGKRSAHSPGKKETNSPVSQDHTVVYPPSVSLLPIPVKAPPIVSPLQPLSVIGWRLLKNQCGECGRVLSSSAALESHVSLHKGRRPFSCTLCGKRFPDSKGLKRHGRVHRNGRIHICQKCGKGFVYRFCLTKHLQMVHSKIRPFVCQICDKGFFTKRDVEAHIRLHTGEKPFHCNLCEKKFARRVELNVHLRWHNGEKRHWCPYCGKGFLDFNNLKRHKYIHTGEKPHACPHCPKNFTQSGHLKKHVKNVHKIQ